MGKTRSLGIIVAAVVLITGCATRPSYNTRGIPAFYLNPPVSKDAIYGVGDAKMSSLSMSRTTALTRARDDVARQIEVLVKNAITDYAQEAGQGTNQQAVEFTEIVSRQLVDITLRGLVTKEVVVARDGRVFAMVEYPTDSLMAAANQTFVRNEAAAFAEFKAEVAVQKLNQELTANPSQAGGDR